MRKHFFIRMPHKVPNCAVRNFINFLDRNDFESSRPIQFYIVKLLL